MSELLKNMNLKAKLFMGFSVVVLLLIVIGTIGFFQISSISGNIEIVGKNSIPAIKHLQLVRGNLLAVKSAILTFCNPYLSVDEIKRELEDIKKAQDVIVSSLKEYEKIPKQKDEEKIYNELKASIQKLQGEQQKIIDDAQKLLTMNVLQRENYTSTLTQRAMAGAFRKYYDDSYAMMSKLLEYVDNYYGNTMVNNAISNASKGNIIIIIITIISSASGLLLATFFGRIIANPIIEITDNLSISANNLEKAGNQVASASQELSSGASELASSVEEITSSMEELQSIVEANTKNVNEAEILMKETVNTAKSSQAEAEELNRLMAEVMETSKKIVKINKAIDDIAFQTNILALNAAVEAARAGDVGRGFAVVAEQVKSLAQKSAESSKETSELIDTVVESINKSAEKTENTTNSFKEAVQRAEKVNVLLDEITRAFKEQAKGANQVTKAISQVNSVVQELAASSEETASSSEEMLSQVEATREMVVGLNGVTKGEKEAKRLSEESKVAGKQDIHDIKSKAHKVHEAIDALKVKEGKKENDKIKSKEKDVEIIKPEEKIPLDDFKDF